MFEKYIKFGPNVYLDIIEQKRNLEKAVYNTGRFKMSDTTNSVVHMKSSVVQLYSWRVTITCIFKAASGAIRPIALKNRLVHT